MAVMTPRMIDDEEDQGPSPLGVMTIPVPAPAEEEEAALAPPSNLGPPAPEVHVHVHDKEKAPKEPKEGKKEKSPDIPTVSPTPANAPVAGPEPPPDLQPDVAAPTPKEAGIQPSTGPKQAPSVASPAPAVAQAPQAHMSKPYDHLIAANRGDMIALNPMDPDYRTKLAALTTHEGMLHAENAREALMHPWGTPENHPGVLGKIGHVLATVGNVAGEALAPRLAQAIPGSHSNLEQQITQGEGEEAAGSKTGLEAAQSDAAENKTPKEANPEQQAFDAQQRIGTPNEQPGDKGIVDAFAKTKLAAAGAKPNAQPIGEAGAQQHAQILGTLTAGMTPQEQQSFMEAYSAKPDDSIEQATKRSEDAKAAAALNAGERDRKMSRDQAKRFHEEQMAATAAARALAEGHKSKSEDVKARQEVGKIYADPMASAERYNVMTSSLHDALANHDQQAMVNLLTNHLGMTMGMQKGGGRITQALLEEAQKSQPWLASVKAKFDKDGYLSGVTLGPDQMKSMVNLARERFAQDIVKARNLAKYAGAEDDGPERTPSTSTMHYYLDMAPGNTPKERAANAKQMAAQDGWTVGK